MSNASAAIAAWRDALSVDRVLDVLPDGYNRSTLAESRQIVAAIRAHDTAEVQKVVRIAQEHQVPLYPFSTGNNWGYGERNPPVDGCAVLDLSGMDKVLDFNEELGLITIQPGVTHQGMYDYLNERGLEFMVPVHGGGPNTSPLGNALERGYGITPHTDHFTAVNSLEVVLPNGEIYRSALTQNGGELVDRAYKWGTGPYLDGIFTQSAMGITTEMTISLAKRPKRVDAFLFSLKDDGDLEPAIERVRDLLNDLPGVTGSVNFMNARRVLSMVEPYPDGQVPSGGIVPQPLIDQMKKDNMVMSWTCAGALYGVPSVVRAARWTIRKRLFGLGKRLVFFNYPLLNLGAKVVPLIPGEFGAKMVKNVATMRNSLDVLSGKPNEIALPLAYWKMGGPPDRPGDLSPSRDGCGLLWYSPLIPMSPSVARKYVNMVERVCTEHGIEPLITMTTLNNRCFDSTIPLVFDGSRPEQAEAAHACYDALFTEGQKMGLLPYRASIRSMRRFVHPEHSYWQLADQLKRAMDPNNIIAPGRYQPHEQYGQGAVGEAAE